MRRADLKARSRRLSDDPRPSAALPLLELSTDSPSSRRLAAGLVSTEIRSLGALRSALRSLAVFLATTLPSATAWACPVCFQGGGANADAYFMTFVLMTALPFVAGIPLILWLRKRIRSASASAHDPGDGPPGLS